MARHPPKSIRPFIVASLAWCFVLAGSNDAAGAPVQILASETGYMSIRVRGLIDLFSDQVEIAAEQLSLTILDQDSAERFSLIVLENETSQKLVVTARQAQAELVLTITTLPADSILLQKFQEALIEEMTSLPVD
ncbi:MAG: hypothetical protein AAF541_10790 [Pseudomonadota bacterium]